MLTLQEAIDGLYRIAITEGRKQSPKRLNLLADFCVQELDNRGIAGAAKEVSVPGIGRNKNWDLAWPNEGKARLGISLKSILSNIPGTVPNRADDLMGEMANVQLRSPEIVTGYIVVFDTQNGLRKDGGRWVDFFRKTVERLSGRDAPSWAAGMVEASAIIEVDFSDGPKLLSKSGLEGFFDRIAECTRERNPDMFT